MSGVAAIRDGKLQTVDDSEIDVELVSANQLFSTHPNSIPMPGAVQAPRVFYGSRFFNQSLPLKNPEAPLLQNLLDGTDRSFDQELGTYMGALRTDRDAEVMDVNEKNITLRDPATGESWKHSLYSRHPLNRFTALTQTPLIAKGDLLKAGQLIAKSNYTDNEGTMAMSVNARVGLVPYKGYTMDDAVVISESLAKRLTSTQSYVEEQDYDDDNKGGKSHYHSLFPTAFKKAQMEKLDDNGVIKVGEQIEPGDPYILLTKPRMFSSQVGTLGKITRGMQT